MLPGSWTNTGFIKAIHARRRTDIPRGVLPSMPRQAADNPSTDDLKIAMAWMKILKPIQKSAPDPLRPSA
jgi:hypothetical protein